MVHISLVSSSSKIRRQMILNVDDLCHVFHLISHSLSSLTVSLATWSERSYPTWQVLILWGWAFESIEVELILVRSTTNTPFIDVLWYCVFLHHSINGFIYSLSWITELIKFTIGCNVHRVRLRSILRILSRLGTWWIDLITIATCLRSSFYLVLNLLLLLLVRVTNLDSLTNLSLLRSIERIEGSSIILLFVWRIFYIGIIIVNIWIVYSISWTSFGWAWSLSSLGSDPSLTLSRWVSIKRFVLAWLHLILSGNISLILLLL